MTAPSGDWSRQDWKYKAPAQAFREAHGNPLYTMVFHGRLQRKMERKKLPVVMRVDALIDRMANGNLSDCVVDAMPRVYDADPIPRKLTQVEIAARLGVSTAAVSGACKLLREESLVLPDPGDGSISPNQCVEGELCEAAQRAGSPNLPLNAPQDDDGLPRFADFKAQWLSQHPDHVTAKTHLIKERENLRAQVRDLSADIHDLELMELAAYRAVCRKIESERRNSGAHSTNGTGANVHGEQNHSGAAPDNGTDANIHGEQSDSAAAGAPDSGCVDTLPVETVQDSTFENGPKPRVFNETAKESLKVEEVPSSSSGVSATGSATTMTVQTPPPTAETAESSSTAATDGEPAAPRAQTPQSITAVEFHRALSAAFRAACKPVPTSSQSAICYVAVGRHAAGFLAWLAGGPDHPPKLPGVRHPGVLPSLVEEFRSWSCAEPPPAPSAPPSEPTEDQERRLTVEYEGFRAAEALRLFAAIPDVVLPGLIDEKHKFLRREGRLDRMSLDARRREAQNLIFQDIEREQVMPFDEWVELKRKSATSQSP